MENFSPFTSPLSPFPFTFHLSMTTASSLITTFDLKPHPEGGYYKETYRSQESINVHALPGRFTSDRCFSTAIYFLLENGNFSAFHRIKSNECWHFYAGNGLLIYTIYPDGVLSIVRLGNDVANGETFQHTVPANCWFASEPAPESTFSFVGCTVAPGFDFEDFEMANVVALSAQYPQHSALIHRLCR